MLFVYQAQPELLARTAARRPLTRPAAQAGARRACRRRARGRRRCCRGSPRRNPDGLEWSIAKVTGTEDELRVRVGRPTTTAAELQEKTAILPDYAFKDDAGSGAAAAGETDGDAAASWPAVDAGTSLSGVVGALIVLAVAVALGFALRRRSSARTAAKRSAAHT